MRQVPTIPKCPTVPTEPPVRGNDITTFQKLVLQGLWADVLANVEEMVRLTAKAEGKQLGSRGEFDGNSLESLAKRGGHMSPTDGRITYLPSRARNGIDKDMLRPGRPAIEETPRRGWPRGAAIMMLKSS